MSRMAHGPRDEVERLAAAAGWRVRLTEARLETSPDFEAWRDAHPDNLAAWLRVQEPWARFGENATAPELLTARRDALHRAGRIGEGRRGGFSGRGRIAAVIGALAVAAALAGAAGWSLTRPASYETAIGERRTVQLADGSRVALDAGTALTVKLSEGRRDLRLLRGQARFDVAHDPRRPFVVHARDREVVALGTSFSVDLLGPTVTVTLMEGRVSVTRVEQRSSPAARISHPAQERTVLHPGDRLVARSGAPQAKAVEKVSLQKARAWETGKLVFEDEPLATVVARVARYSAQPIRVADPEAGALRISGMFDTGDVAAFLDAVTSYLPVDAAPDPDGGVTLRSRTAA